MKLAEALIARSDLQKKLGELRSRITDAMYSHDGEDTEDVTSLLAATDDVTARLETLIVAINRTNTVTPFVGEDVDASLTVALARRDSLAARHKTLTEALGSVSGRRGRWFDDRPSGAKVTVNVSDLRRQVDDLAGQIRRLDLAIQQLNWSTDIIEA